MLIKQHHIIVLVFIVGFLLLPGVSFSQISPTQYSYPNNHISWYTIESEHFRIHFQQGNNRSAQMTARIAEEVYPKITGLYNYKPDTKTDIVLNDRQDYSNGAAYFFDNQIEIWIPSLNTPLRGTHDWLWDVITHEFTHIVQLQVALKKNRRIPAIYFQWLSYSDVRRPDVLYGYPKGIITYPFASINVPAWLAEGVAQYQRSNLYYDYWDSHRDMLLRTAMLSGNPVGFEEMGIFGSKNALARERIYNQGFAFTTFLVDRYGEDLLPKISEILGESGVFSVDNAFEKATGTSGKALFDEFVNNSQLTYKKATETLEFSNPSTIQEKGFYNFYPRLSSGGNNIAYLSNKKHRGSKTQLFIEEYADSLQPKHALDIGKIQTSSAKPQPLRDQDPIIKNIQSAYSFAPSGQSIAFNRQKLNSYGEKYNDLYIYDLKSEKETRITRSQRLSSPSWHPSQDKLAAIQQTGASTNIVEVDLQSSAITPLTKYEGGEQVFTPAWHPNGQALYFSYSDSFTRNIYRFDYKSNKIKPVLQDSLTDFRDPYIDEEANYLYYAADPDGIFNIYRISLEEKNPNPQKMTSVLGGAFMPHVQGNTVLFAEFKANGYKISSTNISESAKLSEPKSVYQQTISNSFKVPDNKDLTKRRNFDEVETLPKNRIQKLSYADSLNLDFFKDSDTTATKLYRHDNTYTSFSFYPVIRFDNYTKKNGSNSRLVTAGKWGNLAGNLLRDMKLGTYFSSREVTNRLSIFGGALFGLTSKSSNGIGDFISPQRLTDLDRDLFLITEYEGLPFIKKRWSPTISIELYNLRRNVSDGLSIEEFPCTACLPETTNIDIAYTIWEADIFFRSKINDNNLLEMGAGYSPYRVQTESFFSQELQQLIPSSSSEYFRGTTLTAAHIYENFITYPNHDIAPVGLRTSFRYTYEPSKLLDDYEVEDGSLSPVYRSVKNHSLETSLRWGYPLGRHSALNFYGRGFTYLNNPDDFFYLDYIGGFTGMRSYPYFAIGGNSTAMAQLAYTFPLFEKINKQVGRHTLDKLFLRIFAETGNGWQGPLEIGNNLKTGAGAEIRFAFNSYYLFPLKLFLSSSYGFSNFDVTLPEEFITESSGGSVKYGRDFIFHFGLTFDFNILNND